MRWRQGGNRSSLFVCGLDGALKKRSDKYRDVKGLLQKLYVRENSTDHVGGIYVFDSKENLEAFRNSDLAKSILGINDEPALRIAYSELYLGYDPSRS